VGSAGQQLPLTQTGVYSVSAVIGSSNLNSVTYSSTQTGVIGWGSFTVSNPFVPPTWIGGLIPSIIQIIQPQTGGCLSNSCPGVFNASGGFFQGSMTSMTLYLRSTNAATGGVFATTGLCSFGLCDWTAAGATSLSFAAGGFAYPGAPFNSAIVWGSGATAVPKNLAMVVSGQGYDSGTGFSTYFSQAQLAAVVIPSSITLTEGTTDVTAPTCTAAYLGQTTLTATASATTVNYTVTCAASTGSVDSGIIVQTTGPIGGPYYTLYTASSVASANLISVSGFADATVSIIGVWALDTAGNAVLYGSCGGLVGYDTLCGTLGGSSAAHVTLSIFAIFAMVMMTLFA